MLLQLQVTNYVLIESLSFEPGVGLNTITGETGAGKSILIGALGLILGDRSDSKAVAGNKGKCIIEGTFDLTSMDLEELFERYDLDYATHTILRREILESGRSRSFVNDTPVSLATIRELGEKLVDIHSQHQTHQIADANFLFHWLDSVCGTYADYQEYSTIFKNFRAKEKALSELQELTLRESAQADYNNFLWEELDKADLKLNEFNDLEDEANLLQNAEEIGSLIGELNNRMIDSDSPIMDELRTFTRQLHKVAPDGSELSTIIKRLEGASIELNDVVDDLRGFGEALQTDASRLQLINDRLQQINQLLVKHRTANVEGLIDLRDKLSDNIFEVAGRQRELELLESEVHTAEKKATLIAQNLHQLRSESVKEVMRSMNSELYNLGLPNARVVLQLEESPMLTSHGKSVFQLMFSSNKGRDIQPAHSVASGGELSRLMLIIKAQMAKKRKLPSIIFDEIDTGVSGEIAKRMADVMGELSKDLQVISITHLPQIAARGNHHFYVYKETDEKGTNTRLKLLEGDQRIHEIAKMLSGDQPTEGALTNAQELLEG
jgi:DNA repair protein RecN (Recombination protein N)